MQTHHSKLTIPAVLNALRELIWRGKKSISTRLVIKFDDHFVEQETRKRRGLMLFRRIFSSNNAG